ncbi:hypothetical protein AAZU54_08275 [Pseudomonas sp. Je.1.5.c]|uniref:hypothetical protein n=1 Tax=Pseudomonas sp. Je.1.5.c TaxID=3142839 RepID=UPI003DA7BC7E
MKSLADIVHGKADSTEPASESLAVRTQAGVRDSAVAILGTAFGASKATEFAEGAAKLVTDREFLGELEGEIGLPKSGETEDEFVSRAKKAMFNMLQAKLK